jgi:hypothetical protein
MTECGPPTSSTLNNVSDTTNVLRVSFIQSLSYCGQRTVFAHVLFNCEIAIIAQIYLRLNKGIDTESGVASDISDTKVQAMRSSSKQSNIHCNKDS